MPDNSDGRKNRCARPRLPVRPAALIIALLVLLPVLAVLILHIPAVQNEIVLGAVSQIAAAAQLEVKLESYRWRPFSGLCLEGVKVRSEGMTVLDCRKVDLSYTLSMGRPHVRVREIYLEKPYLRLEKSHEGKWRVPGKPAGNGQGRGDAGGDPPWAKFPLPKVRVLSGVVEGRQDGKTIFSIKDFTGTLNLKTVKGPHGPEVRLDLDDWRSENRGRSDPPARFGLTGTDIS